VLWGKTASMLAETALAAHGLLRLDLSDCDWLSAEHLIRCSGLLVELQVKCGYSAGLPHYVIVCECPWP